MPINVGREIAHLQMTENGDIAECHQVKLQNPYYVGLYGVDLSGVSSRGTASIGVCERAARIVQAVPD